MKRLGSQYFSLGPLLKFENICCNIFSGSWTLRFHLSLINYMMFISDQFYISCFAKILYWEYVNIDADSVDYDQMLQNAGFYKLCAVGYDWSNLSGQKYHLFCVVNILMRIYKHKWENLSFLCSFTYWNLSISFLKFICKAQIHTNTYTCICV